MKSKIFDCITFFDNNFMFNLRYNILKDFVDYFNYSAHQWHSELLPKITKLTIENNKLKLELKLIKKFLEDAKRKTNEKWEVK